ncbi:MAG: aminopeptidase [bacterium]|nr:aminopeptidase [bacterium]
MSIEVDKKNLEVWADFILNHSLGGIVPEDVVMIKGERIVWPLISVLQDKIFAAGAVADINLVAPDNNRGQVWGASIAKHGTVDQIRRVPQWNHARYDGMTKYIEILGAENPDLFANLPEETGSEMMKADHPFKTLRLAKPWVLTLFPTEGFANMEGMAVQEYTDIIVNASITDPKMLEEVEEPLAQLIKKSNKVRIETQHPTTGKLLELKMDISNRLPVKCTGKRNFPDGEVYTSPDANSTEGEIFVDLPVFYNGVTIQGIYLKFKKGVIVEYSADKEPDTLKKIIETDKGSHRIGEVALGMNSGLQTALKHPLFVEKVGGTLHIAIGESYPDAYVEDAGSDEGKTQLAEYQEKGVLNKSSQHVDIVTDFRPGGCGKAVFIDDIKLEIKDNIWVIPEK